MTEDKKNIKKENSAPPVKEKLETKPSDQKTKRGDSQSSAKDKKALSGKKADSKPQEVVSKDKTPRKLAGSGKERDSQPKSVKPTDNKVTQKSRDAGKEQKASEEKPSLSKGKIAQKSEDSVKKEQAPQPKSVVSESSNKPTKPQAEGVKLQGLFAFKQAMTTFYNEKGESVPVTALKYEPCVVSQIKTQKKESYNAVQVAFKAQKNKRCSKALIGHLTPAGFKEGARFVREIRQEIPEGTKAGQKISLESFKKGDLVKISSFSKGRGFSGVMKKWNFAGGRASHGSKSHRRTGSIGQHTEPARVFPGRKMPGQYGNKKVSKLKIPVVDVFPEEGLIFVKGPVPGARNSLVSLVKM